MAVDQAVIDSLQRDTSKVGPLHTGSLITVADTSLKNMRIDDKYFDQKSITDADIRQNIFDSLALDKIPSLKGLQKDTPFTHKNN